MKKFLRLPIRVTKHLWCRWMHRARHHAAPLTNNRTCVECRRHFKSKL